MTFDGGRSVRPCRLLGGRSMKWLWNFSEVGKTLPVHPWSEDR